MATSGIEGEKWTFGCTFLVEITVGIVWKLLKSSLSHGLGDRILRDESIGTGSVK